MKYRKCTPTIVLLLGLTANWAHPQTLQTLTANLTDSGRADVSSPGDITTGKNSGPSSLRRVTQVLVPPPALPDHTQVASEEPIIVEVRLVIEEKEIEIAPGAWIWAMTFSGTVPGPMIVVHENDYVELTLVNPATNSLPHNIDLHAATGAHGGGALTHVEPGQEVVIRFKSVPFRANI